MTTTYFAKYSRKVKYLELSLEPYSLESIVHLFGKEQLIFIEQLFLFQHEEDKIGDYDFNEDFFLWNCSDLRNVFEFLKFNWGS